MLAALWIVLIAFGFLAIADADARHRRRRCRWCCRAGCKSNALHLRPDRHPVRRAAGLRDRHRCPARPRRCRPPTAGDPRSGCSSPSSSSRGSTRRRVDAPDARAGSSARSASSRSRSRPTAACGSASSSRSCTSPCRRMMRRATPARCSRSGCSARSRSRSCCSRRSRTVVTARLDNTEASNDTRGRVYKEAYEGTLESPLSATARRSPRTRSRSGPPVGTHGLIWYVMFCHGFPALAMLLVALFTLFFATLIARTPTALWAHICDPGLHHADPVLRAAAPDRDHRDRRRDLLAREPPRRSRAGGPMSMTTPKTTTPSATASPETQRLAGARAAEPLARDAAKRAVRGYGMATGDLRPRARLPRRRRQARRHHVAVALPQRARRRADAVPAAREDQGPLLLRRELRATASAGTARTSPPTATRDARGAPRSATRSSRARRRRTTCTTRSRRCAPAHRCPDALIIASLRDPVERAFSHYKERRTNGTEPLSFAEAIDAEPAPPRGRGGAASSPTTGTSASPTGTCRTSTRAATRRCSSAGSTPTAGTG